MDFRRGHRVTNVFRKRSQGHGRISAVTNCDPGRGRMHCAYGSDNPLLDVCNSATVWTIANWTASRCAAKGTIDDGINISVCENKASSQFSQTSEIDIKTWAGPTFEGSR